MSYQPQADGMIGMVKRLTVPSTAAAYMSTMRLIAWEQLSPPGCSMQMALLPLTPKRPDYGAPGASAYDYTSYQAQITCKMGN